MLFDVSTLQYPPGGLEALRYRRLDVRVDSIIACRPWMLGPDLPMVTDQNTNQATMDDGLADDRRASLRTGPCCCGLLRCVKGVQKHAKSGQKMRFLSTEPSSPSA
ncbi:hypothetical protein AAHC03_025631 [Spirometra sp. Aus1]